MSYATNTLPHKDKFELRAYKCVFIGYPPGQKAFKLYNIQTKTVFISRDVVFHETIFPYSDISFNDADMKPSSSEIVSDVMPELTDLFDTHAHSPEPDSSSHHGAIQRPFFEHNLAESSSATNSSPILEPNIQSPLDTCPVQSVPVIRKSNRPKTAPSWMKDYVSNVQSDLYYSQHQFAQSHSSPHTPTVYPFICTPYFSQDHMSFLAQLDNERAPSSYIEAKNSPHWVRAMHLELKALEENDTWTLSELPHGKHTIGCRWVYKVKYHPDGSLDRFKARLVAKGYNQIEGEDYLDSFSPVARVVTVRLLLALATTSHWCLHQLDINNAFLHGFLDEEVYMTPPEGYSKALPGQVCKLKRSLYGLKQASRQWNVELTHQFCLFGFVQSEHDPCLFTKRNGADFMALIVYVDDILITGSNESEIHAVKQFLDQKFTIKDLGVAKYFLGIELTRSEDGLYFNQRKYILDILQDTGLLGCKPTTTPLPKNHHFSTDCGDPISDPSRYRKLVGQLLYLNFTRPDIAFAVQQLSKHVQLPCDAHWHGLLHVLKYLKGTAGLSMFYSADSVIKLEAFSDADWAADPLTRKSVTGFGIFLGSSLISWKAKQQSTVSCSSAEAEYRSMSYTVRELLWLTYLLHDFGVALSLPISLWCDNKAAIYITENHVFHERTKHLEIDCHFVRIQYQQGLLVPLHTPSSHQLADVFTKALSKPLFSSIVSKLGMKTLLHCLA